MSTPVTKTNSRPRYRLVRLSSTGRLLGLGLRSMGRSAADELHRGEGAKEKHRRDAEGVQSKPAHREDRVVAWRCGDWRCLCHGLFQADIEFRFAFVALAHHGSLAFRGLEVGIRTGSPEGVVRQAGGDEQEACQKDGRQCHGVDHPVTDARDDFEERTFSC